MSTSSKTTATSESAECVELLKHSDIVVTNPPFSLFREFVAQLVERDKKFLILLVYGSLQVSLPRIWLTWILTDPDHATWRNEFTLDGETWSLIEEYQMVAG